MNMTPCQGHNTVFFAVEPGDKYISSRIKITREQFNELDQAIQNSNDLALYHFILSPGEKFSPPNFALRIDNEARTDFNNFFNLQAQINKNGKQLSDTKTTVAQVFVHKDAIDIPKINTGNNFLAPCDCCMQNLVEAFKDALQKSFDVTSKRDLSTNFTPVGQRFHVVPAIMEKSKRFFSELQDVAETPKKAKKNRKS